MKMLLITACAAAGFARQQPPTPPDQLTAREIFYREAPQDEKLPPLTTPHQPVKKQVKAAPAMPHESAPVASSAKEQSGNLATVAAVPVAEHFGLRYRLLKVDKTTNRATPIPADAVFHAGDCLALELEPNRAGYLYVLAKESNGNWHSLFPSPEMKDESEVLHAHEMQRAPQKYCFELDEQPGEENLYVVLSRNPEQAQSLHAALFKNESSGPSSPQPASSPMMADNVALDKEANNVVTELGSRGFKVTKTGATGSNEEKYSVYVVPASLEKKDTIFADIRINHQ